MALMMVLAISGTLSVLAGNRLVLNDGGPIAIKPGETKEITVRGCVKTPNINKKNSLYVLVWMYNEFLFFYKKEPYKQFIWRYIGQISPQIREKSSLGHFCHHFLYIKGNGKEGKVHFDLVYTDMAKTTIRHVVFNSSFAS